MCLYEYLIKEFYNLKIEIMKLKLLLKLTNRKLIVVAQDL